MQSFREANEAVPPAAGATGARDTTEFSPDLVTERDYTGDSGFHAANQASAAVRHVGAVRSVVIIVNELAPRARDARWRELFEQTLGAEVEITEVRVRHFEGAVAAARGAAAWDVDLLIAVGGDGTVNACVNGLGASRTRLAVVPAGTANDLARMIGERGFAGEEAVSLQSYERRDIDAIDCNGTRYYSAGGLGWVADVAAKANHWRAGTSVRRWMLARLGSLIYTLAAVATILFSRSLGARYKIRYRDAANGRNKELDVDAYGMIVANCNRIGKAFHLAPVSEVDDGRFELIVFPRQSRVQLLKTVLAAQAGRLFDVPGIEWIQVFDATVECDKPQQFFGDGEVFDFALKFELAIASTPVRLMAPPEAALQEFEDTSLALPPIVAGSL